MTEIASKPSSPCARSEDLIVEELGEEILVYDMKADRGHCLSPMAARVWRRCDGRTPAKDMSAELDLDPDAVDRALDELAACKLLEPTPELTVVAANGNGATRRELATRFVKAGAVAAAAPLIVSVDRSDARAGANAGVLRAVHQTRAVAMRAGRLLLLPARGGGSGFLCVPRNNVGVYGSAVRRSPPTRTSRLGCLGLGPCAARRRDREHRAPKRSHRMPSPSLTPTEAAPTEPPPAGPTEPAPTPEAPAPETTAAPTTEAPATAGSTTPPASEAAPTP